MVSSSRTVSFGGGRPRRKTLGMRNDVYRRPLEAALDKVGLSEGWKVADVGAGQGDVSVALAEVVGRSGRVYAIDADPAARDETARAAAAHSQVVAITQVAEELRLPEPIDLVYCRFLLLHVTEPERALAKMRDCLAPGGFLVAQEPITSAGRVGGRPLSMPSARHPDIGALLPSLVRDCGLVLTDAWGHAPAWAGPGPVPDYLGSLSGVHPGEEAVVLPPLVTVIAHKSGSQGSATSLVE